MVVCMDARWHDREAYFRQFGYHRTGPDLYITDRPDGTRRLSWDQRQGSPVADEIATTDGHRVFQFTCHEQKRTIREDNLLLLIDRAIAAKPAGMPHALIPLSAIAAGRPERVVKRLARTAAGQTGHEPGGRR